MEAVLLGHTNRYDELTPAEHFLDSQTAKGWLVIWSQNAESTEQGINIFISTVLGCSASELFDNAKGDGHIVLIIKSPQHSCFTGSIVALSF